MAYSYSLYFSDQFSCIKFFDLSYGLFYTIFQSLNHLKKDFLDFLFIIKTTLSITLSRIVLTCGTHMSYTHYDNYTLIKLITQWGPSVIPTSFIKLLN